MRKAKNTDIKSLRFHIKVHYTKFYYNIALFHKFKFNKTYSYPSIMKFECKIESIEFLKSIFLYDSPSKT